MLEGLSDNARAALIGLAGAAAAFVVFRGGGGGAQPSDPLAAVPKDTFLVATLDLAELRRSPLHDVVLGKDGLAIARALPSRAIPIHDLADACGFDPLSRVDELAFAVPEEGAGGELGLAARVNVTRDELARCSGALARQHGGGVATREIGGFVVAESAAPSGAAPKLAYRRGGLLVVGRGAWFDAMLDAAARTKPGLGDALAHAKLRATLTSKPGFAKPTLLVSAVLPRSLRDRLKSEMDKELPAGADDGARAAASAVMAGVLDVAAAGLALEAGAGGGNVEAAVELVCDTSEGCAAVEKLITKKRLDWSKGLALRLIGLGPALDSLKVERSEARIRVTASAAADALVRAFVGAPAGRAGP